MVVRRNREERYLAILEVIRHGVSIPSRIMGEANVDWNFFHSALFYAKGEEHVIKVESDDDKERFKRYKLTVKGADEIIRLRDGGELPDFSENGSLTPYKEQF